MKIDFSFKNHIFHKIFIYLVAIIASSLVICFSISYKTQATRKEMYNVFIGADLISDNLREKINSSIGDYILEIHTYSYLPNNTSTYSTAYQAYGLNYADILILPNDKVSDYDTYSFVQLNEEFYSNDDYIVEGKFHYGKLLFDGNKGLLTDSIQYENKNYFLFINQKSPHTLKFSSDGTTDLTYKLLKDIFNNEN